MANIRCGTIAVIRDRRHDDRNAARRIAFVLNFFVVDIAQLAGSLRNRTLDVLVRHIARLRLGDNVAELAVDGGIASAVTDGNRNLTTDFCKDFSALCVSLALFMLNIRPFRMTRHKIKPPG